jgi:GPI transamidase subunit PIG-U
MGIPTFISLCSMMVPVLLNVVDHWMWLEANNGNANYMYFQCLAYNVFWGIVLGQFVSASVQRDKALRVDLEEYYASKDKEQTNMGMDNKDKVE